MTPCGDGKQARSRQALSDAVQAPSTVGARLEWRKAPKKGKKNMSSEAKSKTIPYLSPTYNIVA